MPAPDVTAPRDLATAQHEAAHVVVGVALGLRLSSAVTGLRSDPYWGRIAGATRFDGRYGSSEAWALMLAAGVYYEERRGHPKDSAGDRRLLRRYGYWPGGHATLAAAAGAILESRREAWEAVTRALLERDITGADVERIARCEPLAAE
jgi:hypothetical protein